MMEWISPLMMSDWKGNHQYDSFPPSINLIEKDRTHLASQTLGIQIVKVPGCRLTKDVSLQGLIPTIEGLAGKARFCDPSKETST